MHIFLGVKRIFMEINSIDTSEHLHSFAGFYRYFSQRCGAKNI